ncbi:N-acetylglucosamine-6-phosphate deacetylase [Brumicola nitratireducens]|nr:N-acetylglucosamine-6-phosphate deacetylase [Glaciecola nitratireducens]
MTTYFAKRLFDGKRFHDNVYLEVNGDVIGRITQASENTAADVILNGLVCAGFIDTQVNGGGGVLFNYAPSLATLLTMMRGHSRYGTTAMLPTIITDSSEVMKAAANAVAEALIAEALPTGTSGILGIHYEGPHLSNEKRGIHPSSHVRSISDADLATFTRQDTGKVMVTLAPENVSPDIITDLVNQGVVVSLGHSAATVEQALAAIDAGATCTTHLFNAMSGLTAREPGLINIALSDQRLTSGLIVDLHHVHPQNCALAYQCIGAERLMLVTDAMAHVGSDLQTLPWLDSTITRKDGKLTLDNGSLAGSCLDMSSAVRNMYSLLRQQARNHDANTLLANVLNMASRVPANLLGIVDRGSLQVGSKADFVLLSDDLHVEGTWACGVKVDENNSESTLYQ